MRNGSGQAGATVEEHPPEAEELGAAEGIEGLLRVVRRRVEAVGLDPDLQEVRRIGFRCVVFAVLDAVARAHPLQFPRA